MKVKSIRLRNFRSFIDSGEVLLDQINVLIGANNAGKTSVLRGLHQLQKGLSDPLADVRVGSTIAEIVIQLGGGPTPTIWGIAPTLENFEFRITLKSSDRRGGTFDFVLTKNNQQLNIGDIQLPAVEPNHFIVPILSKRKTAGYGEDIREEVVKQISPYMTNLSAKLSRLANPEFPMYREYGDACKAILGFVVTAIPAINGQRPGIYLPDQSTVPIDQMGEGVANIVHLLSNLAVSRGKLFLIEEPENDLHPTALKALLDLIQKSSEFNQFVISTHSNIVVSHLCSAPNSRLFRVAAEMGQLPTVATIEPIPPSAEARIQALQELGYAFSDFDLWDGWLLFEESSAERIVREYLIPWFTPQLKKIKTVAASGIGNVEPAFVDLHRLMLFTHLQPAYAGRAWVLVDGDEKGKELVEKLKSKFPTVGPTHFSYLDQPQFELYYPSVFGDRSNEVASIPDKQTRRSAKRELLLDVMKWLDDDLIRGRSEMEKSAEPVIKTLKQIEREFLGG